MNERERAVNEPARASSEREPASASERAGETHYKMLQSLIQEAIEKGYTSPCLNARAVCVPFGANPPPKGFLSDIEARLPGWLEPIRHLQSIGALGVLDEALTEMINEKRILAPSTDKFFYAMERLPLDAVQVVFLGQDPYPTSDTTIEVLKQINGMPHDEVVSIIGIDYETMDIAKPKERAGFRQEGRPNVMIGAVPYAMGRALGYPAICQKPPVSFENMRKSVCSSYGVAHMDNELSRWSAQGVLMLNSCPVLYEGSSKNPHIFTTWTSEILRFIAQKNKLCVFVLLGNAAQSYKTVIVGENVDACIIEAGHPSSRNKKGNFAEEAVFARINTFRDIVSEKTGIRLRPIVW